MTDLDLGTLRGRVELDVDSFDKKYASVQTLMKRLTSTPIPDLVIDANVTPAEKAIKQVEAAGEKLVKREFDPQIDADIAKAQKKVTTVERELDVLRRMDTSPEVTADIAKAEKKLDTAKQQVKALDGIRSEMVVVADTAKAETALDDVADKAVSAGKKGGEGSGKSMAAGIVGALATIPVAGAVVLIGKQIADGLLSGLQNEVREDLFSARTGLDEATAARFGRAAGEAYASNWGESIAANLDSARTAVQSQLLDPAATARDTEAVVEQLTGVATILGEDIPRVARSAAQAIKTGMAKDATGAFDLLVKGQHASLNVSEDLLDTIDEYGTQFRKLGLEGPAAFGLMAQAVRAGARDTDTAADALKEYAIRAVDGSKLTAESFTGIGLSASKMSAQIAAGGPEAAAALDLTLDRLRQVEDPALRAQLAVGLFGTKAEDLGDALYAMDLTTAVDQLGQVEGAAQRALTTLGDNAAGTIETATRNIALSADGIKGALAQAFNPQIEGFATFVTENREQVMTFLLDAANAAIDFGRVLANAAADGTQGFGDFVGSAGPAILGFIESILEGLDSIPFVDMGDSVESFREMKEEAERGFAAFDDGSERAADAIRRNLIEKGLDPAQEKLNDIGIPMVAQAALHDAAVRAATDLADVGYAANGSRLDLAGMNGVIDLGTAAGRQLNEQLIAVAASLDEQTRAGVAAGESQADLTARYDEGRAALVEQLVQMGLTEQQAADLTAQYGAIPGKVDTIIAANTVPAATSAAEARAMYDGLGRMIVSTTITADTSNAEAALARVRTAIAGLSTGASSVTDIRYAAQAAMAVKRANGGPIYGPGTTTSDSILTRLSTDEHVWSALEVKGAGGHAAVASLRDRARVGNLPGLRDGGTVGRSAVMSTSTAPAPVGATTVSLEGATVVVQIGEREFTGYVSGIADDRVGAAVRGVRAGVR